MSTTFIAVKCYQCSTMQVKQQKKSSNKWSCAICNEKQSVRQAFARSSFARDVRKFVQSFNLARQNLEQEPTTLANAIAPTPTEVSPHPSGSFQKQKRTDWTEYLDFEHGEEGKVIDLGSIEEGKGVSEVVGLESEIEVVTELPKQLWKQVLAKRKGKEIHDSNKYQKVVEKQPSKWSEYLETEDNEIFERGTDSCNPYSTLGGKDVLQSQFNDKKVEEDIHPHFM